MVFLEVVNVQLFFKNVDDKNIQNYAQRAMTNFLCFGSRTQFSDTVFKILTRISEEIKGHKCGRCRLQQVMCPFLVALP